MKLLGCYTMYSFKSWGLQSFFTTTHIIIICKEKTTFHRGLSYIHTIYTYIEKNIFVSQGFNKIIQPKYYFNLTLNKASYKHNISRIIHKLKISYRYNINSQCNSRGSNCLYGAKRPFPRASNATNIIKPTQINPTE